MSYKAIIQKVLELKPIEGADNIQTALIGDYRVIVGKDTNVGDVVCFFETGGQLSEEFATTNDLIRRKDPETGLPAGGFFEDNRRVKALRLRNTVSEGFSCPLTYLAYTGYDITKLKVGDQFDTLNDKPICKKYVTPATQRRIAGAKQRRKPTWQTKMFAEHIDTGQFKREYKDIPAGAIIHISVKIHGTSHRFSNVLVEEEKTGWRLLLAKLFRQPRTTKTWTCLHGTRRVVLHKDAKPGFYGSHAFRYLAATPLTDLHKGEVVYGEIVGWTDSERPIMGTHSLEHLRDKKLKKQFGDSIVYKYGCQPGVNKFYVYRITQVNEDGYAVDLSWPQVQQRSKQLGFETVPHIETFVFDGNHEALRDKVFKMVDVDPDNPQAVPSVLDPSHIEEGVVVRYECNWGIGWLKHKSFLFGVLEGYQKESDDFVDEEEAESVEETAAAV